MLVVGFAMTLFGANFIDITCAVIIFLIVQGVSLTMAYSLGVFDFELLLRSWEHNGNWVYLAFVVVFAQIFLGILAA